MFKYKCAGKKHPAKDTAWKWFSLYIRARDCLSTTGSLESCECVTCNKIVPYDLLDSGHGFGHRQNAVLFDETIVYAQCRKCNRGGDGEKQAFKNFFVYKYGIEWYEMKLQGAKKSVFITDDEFRLIGDHYRKAYKKLLENV